MVGAEGGSTGGASNCREFLREVWRDLDLLGDEEPLKNVDFFFALMVDC